MKNLKVLLRLVCSELNIKREIHLTDCFMFSGIREENSQNEHPGVSVRAEYDFAFLV